MRGSGEPLPQLKFTVVSVRVSVGAPVNGAVGKELDQYCPKSPVPLPTTELLRKLALAIALASKPVLKALAVTAPELVTAKGPVYRSELVVGTVLSRV